jgi:hypothetical protein
MARGVEENGRVRQRARDRLHVRHPARRRGNLRGDSFGGLVLLRARQDQHRENETEDAGNCEWEGEPRQGNKRDHDHADGHDQPESGPKACAELADPPHDRGNGPPWQACSYG